MIRPIRTNAAISPVAIDQENSALLSYATAPRIWGSRKSLEPAYNDHLHSRDLTSDIPRDERERLFNNWGVDVSYLFWVTLRAKLDQ